MTLFTAIETFDILGLFQVIGNHLSYPSMIMVMRFSIDYLESILWVLDLAFKGPIILLHRELAFSKFKDSLIVCVASEFGIILFTVEVSLCKKSVKVSFGPCITLLNVSVLF